MAPVADEVGDAGERHPGRGPEELERRAGEGALLRREELARHDDPCQTRALQDTGALVGLVPLTCL